MLDMARDIEALFIFLLFLQWDLIAEGDLGSYLARSEPGPCLPGWVPSMPIIPRGKPRLSKAFLGPAQGVSNPVPPLPLLVHPWESTLCASVPLVVKASGQA